MELLRDIVAEIWWIDFLMTVAYKCALVSHWYGKYLFSLTLGTLWDGGLDFLLTGHAVA
jgi:hypothetical protein